MTSIFQAQGVTASSLVQQNWVPLSPVPCSIEICKFSPTSSKILYCDSNQEILLELDITRTTNVLKSEVGWVEYDDSGNHVHGFRFLTDVDATKFVNYVKSVQNPFGTAAAMNNTATTTAAAASSMATSNNTSSAIRGIVPYATPMAVSSPPSKNENNNNNNTATAAAAMDVFQQQQQALLQQQQTLSAQLSSQQVALAQEQARLAQMRLEDERRRAESAIEEERKRAKSLQQERDMFAQAARMEQQAIRSAYSSNSNMMAASAPMAPSGYLTNGSATAPYSTSQALVQASSPNNNALSIVQHPSAILPVVPLASGPHWASQSLTQLGSIACSRPVAPMGSMRGMTGVDSMRRVAILDHNRRKDGILSSTYVAYSVQLLDRPAVCAVDRRYSDFELLHQILSQDSEGLVFIPPLPPKKTFGSSEEDFVQQRHRMLERYLNRMLCSSFVREHEAVKMFLESTDDKYPKTWEINKAKHVYWKQLYQDRIKEVLRGYEYREQTVADFEAKMEQAKLEIREQKDAIKAMIKASERTLNRLRGDAESVQVLGRSLAMLESVERNRLSKLFGIPDTTQRPDLTSPSLLTYERTKQAMGLVANSYERQADVENIMLLEALETELQYENHFLEMLSNRKRLRETLESLTQQELKAGRPVPNKAGETAETMKVKYVDYVVSCIMELDRFRCDLSSTIGMLFRDYAGAQVRHLVALGTIWQRHFDLAADLISPVPRDQRA